MNTIAFSLKLFFVLSGFIFFNDSVQGSTPRNLLQKRANEQAVKEALVPREKWINYPLYADRSGWDQFLGTSKDGIVTSGESYLKYEWQVIKATDYLEFSRSGSRVIMEEPYNQNLNAISSLFLAEMAEGKGRFIDQLINGVFAACEMTSWSLSAHLSLQLKNKRFPDHNQQVIDLLGGDVGALFSWIYFFLNKEFDKADPLIAQRMKYEIKRRIFEPYMNVNHFWWMGFEIRPTRVVNNWNVWCNSNVLQSFALIEEDPDKLAKAVYKTMQSVDLFINYNKGDGACEEGPSYWGHAAGKLYDYLQILSDITGGKISIFDEPIIKNMGEYISRSYVGNGWVVNFSDASAIGGGDPALIYRFGKAVKSEEMKSFAAYLIRQQNGHLKIRGNRDIFRTLQSATYNKEMGTVTPALPSAPYTWYPQTEFCYIKNRTYFFAAKGGFNNESHNHNDVGTFALYVDTIPFFIDAGVGTYTRQTFGRERYTIWTMQSNYHNLPLINGAAQQFGAAYKSSDVSFNVASKKFSLDISKAYNNEASVKNWQRSYDLSDKGLVIEEAFDLTSLKEPTSIHFLVSAKPVINKAGVVLLEKNSRKVEFRYTKRLFNVEVDTLSLNDKRLSDVWGSEIYRIRLIAEKPQLKGKYNYTIAKVF
ncbi:heparinase II/III family protein [Niabella yanshanensis]|uniref:Heparinase II/III family protein n=1 Tax=Niabella yanshanensis TaxID=577386 RepID=A0ABZ0W207_9BACT|nr:heparinase II/III family protein [Niabella yanshanensis]WQD36658.1 heparinase II/III family protein [Niabella yanshanensis]